MLWLLWIQKAGWWFAVGRIFRPIWGLSKSDKPLTEERVLELKDIKKRYDYAIKLGLIYGYIGIDTANFATAVQNFTVMLMEKASRQKSELAKTAYELFNDELFMFFLEQ